MTATIVADRLADPAELEDCPVLSTRDHPQLRADKRPSVAELVRLDVPATLHKSQDGTPQALRRPRLPLHSHSLHVDPWHLLAPEADRRVLLRRLRLRPPPRPRDPRLPGGRRDLGIACLYGPQARLPETESNSAMAGRRPLRVEVAAALHRARRLGVVTALDEEPGDGRLEDLTGAPGNGLDQGGRGLKLKQPCSKIVWPFRQGLVLCAPNRGAVWTSSMCRR